MLDLNTQRAARIQNILHLLGTAAALGLLFFAAWTTLKSHDTFGYLAMGRAFFENGQSLFTDHLSITHQGERLLPNPWLYSLISGGVDFAFGPNGLFSLFTLLWAVPLLLLSAWAYRRKIDGLSVFVATLFLTAAFLTRVQLRPELVAYTFLILSLLLANRYTLDGKWKWVAAMGGIFVIWTQFHSTSSMMLPIFGAAWLQRLLTEFKTKPNARTSIALKHAGWLIGFFLLGFLNPNGWHYHPFALANVHQNEWYGLITEYTGDQKFSTLVQWINLLGGAMLLLLFFNLGDFSKVGILAVMLFYALQIPKLAPHVSTVLATLGLLYVNGRSDPKFRTPSLWNWMTKSTELVRMPISRYLQFGVLIVVLGATAVQLAKQIEPLSQASLLRGAPLVDEDIFAVDVAQYIKVNQLAGPTFSELGTASYLTYTVGSGITTYVDQRIGILIPKTVFDSYREAIIREKNLVELSEKHRFKVLVGSNGWPERLIDTALRSRKFSILFIGRSHSLLVPTESGLGFDQISWLMHDPACLKVIDPRKLSEERSRLEQDNTPSGRALHEIADTALKIIENKNVDLTMFNNRLNNPHVLRLVAYSWREAGQPEPSLQTQQALKAPAKLVDFLESALALTAVGANDIAIDALFNSGPDYYFGSRQKAAQFLYVVDLVLPKLPKDTPTPPWLDGLRKALKEDPGSPEADQLQRSCRPRA